MRRIIFLWFGFRRVLTPGPMTDAEAYIALNMVPRIGPVRVRRLIDAMGSPVEILRAPASRLEGVEGIGPEAAK